MTAEGHASGQRHSYGACGECGGTFTLIDEGICRRHGPRNNTCAGYGQWPRWLGPFDSIDEAREEAHRQGVDVARAECQHPKSWRGRDPISKSAFCTYCGEFTDARAA